MLNNIFSGKKNIFKFSLFVVLVLALMVVPAMTIFAGHNPDLSDKMSGNNTGNGSIDNPFIEQDKIPICHSTGNSGYNSPNPSLNSFFGIGGNGHDQDEKDIIPPFHYDKGDGVKEFDGNNWEEPFISIWENDCTGDGIVDPDIDIAVEKTVDESNPSEEETIIYTITVSNIGTDDASDVEITDELPNGVTFVGANPTPDDNDNGTLTWNYETISSGQNKTIDVTVTVNTDTAGDIITNEATSSTENDDKPNNNSGSSEFTVAEEQDEGPNTGTLTIEKVIVGNESASPSDFSFQIKGEDAIAFNESGENTETLSLDETYTVTEVDPGANYTVGYENCDDIQLSENDSTTCTITNTYEEPEEEPDTATLTAQKIVCDDESLLPDWGADGVSVDANTAQTWVDDNDGCEFEEGWDFQWAYGGIENSAGDDTFTGPKDSPWETFGPTDGTGTVSEEIVIDGENTISVREVLKSGYIPFTFITEGENNTDNATAEFYCSTDGANYDNLEWIDIQPDEEYHCVALNVLEEIENACTVTAVSDTSNVVLDTGENAVETWVHSSWGSIPDADWIWNSYKVEDPQTTTTYTFQKYFSWTGDTINDANIEIGADDQFKLFINGDLVADRYDGQNHFKQSNIENIDIADNIQPGLNEINIEAKNISSISDSPTSNPAGLIYKLTIDGEGETCTTDSLPACADGIDNDGDGLVDYPNDPQCESPEDDSENPSQQPPLPECSDGEDNDDDGETDADDPSCHTDGDENNPDSYDPQIDDESNDPEPEDVCPDLDGFQETIPDGYEKEEGQCVEEETESSSSGGSSRSTGGFIQGGGIIEDDDEPTPEVLGATTSVCEPIFDQYLRRGSQGGEVFLLQFFLNSYVDAGLTVDGVYGQATEQAIHKFQQRYFSDIIQPWVPPMNPYTTGRFYKTTRAKANQLLGCPETDAIWLEDPEKWFTLEPLES